MPGDHNEGATSNESEKPTGDDPDAPTSKPTGDDPGAPTFDFTRRDVMRAGGSVAAASFIGDTWFEDDSFDLSQAEEVEVRPQGLEYFTIEQARIIHDLTGRIYPSDENGPGAPEAGVVFFVDEQMNSAWGRGDRWYMEPPFAGKDPTQPFEQEPEDPEEEEVEISWADQSPAATQGWQYSVSPNAAYDQGIEALEQYAQNEYGESFTELDGSQQDEIVTALQNGEMTTFEDKSIDPEGFFLLVRENTLEGMFADPMYGGNREMIGWRLKNFPGTPGALGSYRDQIADGEYVEPGSDDFRKLADDVESLGLGGDGGGGGNESDSHSHVHDASEAEYPKIVDEEAAKGNADGDDGDEGGDE
jgi:hypothetical protein